MTKLWIKKAVEYLKQSLSPIPHELNEIDWKENLSPDNKRLCNHLSAFSNYPGGGFLVFGIEDTTAELKGITKENAEEIVLKLSNLSRDSLNPAVSIDHSLVESRNEILASAFRRYGICEERGSGFEKAVSAIELYGLPPLKFEELENSFRVTMYSPKPFAKLTLQERVEACYQHSIIQYYSMGGMTNASLRERFKMSERQRPQISLVIKEALAQHVIKPKDPNNTSMKFAEYIPFWG